MTYLSQRMLYPVFRKYQPCPVESCSKNATHGGYCLKHRKNVRTFGSPLPPDNAAQILDERFSPYLGKAVDGICPVEGCCDKAKSRGLCPKHYMRVLHGGSVAAEKPQDPPLERFHRAYTVNETTGCWDWKQLPFASGYGAFWDGRKQVPAHRYSYEVHHGPIPKGLSVLHSCDNRSCVCPQHLRAGTHQENMDDMHARGRARSRKDVPQEYFDQLAAVRLRTTQSILAIADAFGVSASTARKDWKTVRHVGVAFPANTEQPFGPIPKE